MAAWAGGPRMTNTAIDATGPGVLAPETGGPLEQRHLQYANYRAVADGSKITRTHWHIALANGLGWGFDGMDGVIFALISPLIIKEFALDIPTYRTGFQIWLALGMTGLYSGRGFPTGSAAAPCWPSILLCSR